MDTLYMLISELYVVFLQSTYAIDECYDNGGKNQFTTIINDEISYSWYSITCLCHFFVLKIDMNSKSLIFKD